MPQQEIICRWQWYHHIIRKYFAVDQGFVLPLNLQEMRCVGSNLPRAASSFKKLREPLKGVFYLNKTANLRIFLTDEVCKNVAIASVKPSKPFVIGLKYFKLKHSAPDDCSAVTLVDGAGEHKYLPDRKSKNAFSQVSSTQEFSLLVNCTCLEKFSSLWITIFEYPETCDLKDNLSNEWNPKNLREEDIPLGDRSECTTGRVSSNKDTSIPVCEKSYLTSSTRPLGTSQTPTSLSTNSLTVSTKGSTVHGYSTVSETEVQLDKTVTRRPQSNSTPSAGKDKTVILASAVAAGVLLIILVVVIVIVSWRRHKIRSIRKSAGQGEQREATGDDNLLMSSTSGGPLTATGGLEKDATYSCVDDSSAFAREVAEVECRNTYDVIGVEPGSSSVALQITSDTDRPTYDELQIPKVKRLSPQNYENVNSTDANLVSYLQSGAVTELDLKHMVIDGCEYAVVQK
ncbi:uncharacterized protein LOC135462960 [Liolophura sinensis]|uniref:uncharacterized protein LOC135462960 n=1 Tax=Liolophura sinensis TaxID=3198878 RepID=UPI003158964A